MKCLALDLSSVKASLALTENSSLLAEISFASDKNHSSELFPLLDQLTQDFSSIDCWAVNLGPGSFTGVRASIAAVSGLNFPFQKPIYGVNAHDAICADFPRPPALIQPPDFLCLISDARRGEVYATVYEPRPEGWTLFKNTHISTIQTLSGIFAPEKNVLFAGPGVDPFRSELTSTFDSRAQFAPESPLLPQAPAVARIATQMHAGQITACTRLEPIYLRPVSYVKIADRQKGPSLVKPDATSPITKTIE